MADTGQQSARQPGGGPAQDGTDWAAFAPDDSATGRTTTDPTNSSTAGPGANGAPKPGGRYDSGSSDPDGADREWAAFGREHDGADPGTLRPHGESPDSSTGGIYGDRPDSGTAWTTGGLGTQGAPAMPTSRPSEGAVGGHHSDRPDHPLTREDTGRHKPERTRFGGTRRHGWATGADGPAGAETGGHTVRPADIAAFDDGGTAVADHPAPAPRRRGGRHGSGDGLAALGAPRGFTLGAVVLGVTLAPLALILLTTGSDEDTGSRGNGTAPSAAPPGPEVTVTATVPAPPTEPTPPEQATPPPESDPPETSAPSYRRGDFTQLVNARTGLCLDIEDGELKKRTDVVSIKCSASDTQRWRVDIDRGVIQSHADPYFCLDGRGEPDRAVVIRACDAVDDDDPSGLSFTVDAAGTIRAVAVRGHVLTPRDDKEGSGVVLRKADSGQDQRWRSGKSPV
ncbi:hypothetical protein DY218_04485 [Streptomyces triticagri]|uniref:Ricin B lectin domain-containing protein n=1 Tax=Streptomyces triticagri TaxID=2293568 RepID=A0A372MA74_9ACTN|nr:ricin-type beta-trefoil lectin domain protein [Streptomyces triticagri]RFU87848.1 hypothetical protein DY218_04485 [Streptomyces triticagri]